MKAVKRLPRGTLIPLIEKTGLPKQYLSDIVATRRRPGRKRAKFLEHAAREIGLDIPAAVWLFGSTADIRSALLNPQ